MKKPLVAAILLFAAACATTDVPEPLPPVTPPPDPRVGEMQTQMTELLERIDVLNERLARLEESPAAPAAAPMQATATATATSPTVLSAPEPAAPMVRVTPRVPLAADPEAPAPQRSDTAMAGARLAEQYRQAIILYGRGRHADARRAFQEVFETDTGGDLADNSLFWIGETYFAARDYTTAIRFYTRVVTDYPEENKAPDALFKTALAQERTGDLALARRTLQQVIEKYPYSSPASTAKQELQRIRY